VVTAFNRPLGSSLNRQSPATPWREGDSTGSNGVRTANTLALNDARSRMVGPVADALSCSAGA
jgi:hypothetical protein